MLEFIIKIHNSLNYIPDEAPSIPFLPYIGIATIVLWIVFVVLAIKEEEEK